MFPEKKKYKSDHILLDKETFEHDLKDFSYTFIELPKFTKTIDELDTLTEKWIYFFKHAEETSMEDLKKLIANDEILERVYHELDRFYWTEQELLDYEQVEKAKSDYLSSLENKFIEGKVEGKKEGKREMAKEMLRDNESEAKIIKYTELTSNELAEIRKSLLKKINLIKFM